MSLMPSINFPINFYFWEGSSPSSKETKGRGKKGKGRRERKGGSWGQDRHRRGRRGGRQACGPVSTLHLPQIISRSTHAQTTCGTECLCPIKFLVQSPSPHCDAL